MPTGASPGCPRHRHHPHPVGGRRAAGPGPGAPRPTCHCSPGARRLSCGHWPCGAVRAPAACLAGRRSSWPLAPGSPRGASRYLLGWPSPLPSSRPRPGFLGPHLTTGTAAPHSGSSASGWGHGPGCYGWSACWSSCLPRSRGCVESCGRLAGGGRGAKKRAVTTKTSQACTPSHARCLP